jgi:hypothetical protein
MVNSRATTTKEEISHIQLAYLGGTITDLLARVPAAVCEGAIMARYWLTLDSVPTPTPLSGLHPFLARSIPKSRFIRLHDHVNVLPSNQEKPGIHGHFYYWRG